MTFVAETKHTGNWATESKNTGDIEPAAYSRTNASANKPKLVIEYTEASTFTPKIIII